MAIPVAKISKTFFWDADSFSCKKLYIFLGLIALAGTFILADDRPKKNIVVFVNHDHSVNAWSTFEGTFKELNPTKNIDNLSDNGSVFLNAFASNGSAAPGIATMLTGKFAHSHGLLVNGQKFEPKQESVVRTLKEGGYETAVFGRWNLKTKPSDFDHWEVLEDSTEFYNPSFISPSGKFQIEGHSTDIITDLLMKWIKGRIGSKKPFLAFALFNATQRPWMPTLRQLETYNDILLPEPESLYYEQKDLAPASRYQQIEISKDLNLTHDLFIPPFSEIEGTQSISASTYHKNLARMNEEQLSSWQLLWRPQNEAYLRGLPQGEDLLRWKYQRFAKNYLRCIRDVDDNIERFRSYFRNSSEEECILFYTANQGRFIGENGWFGNQWMMDLSMRVPLLITSINGKVKSGHKIEYCVQDIDIAPTILSLSGISRDLPMQGFALNLNDWNSSQVRKRDALYFHHYEFPGLSMVSSHNGIRTPNHKILHYYQFGEWEFFDLKKDPSELTNVFESNKMFNILKAKLFQIQDELRDNADKSIMPEKWRRIYRGPSARRE